MEPEYDKLIKSFENIAEYLNKKNKENESKEGKQDEGKTFDGKVSIGLLSINLESFLDLLKNHGDAMTDAEIKECLEVLTGNSSISSADNNKIDYQRLFNDILGFKEIDKNDN